MKIPDIDIDDDKILEALKQGVKDFKKSHDEQCAKGSHGFNMRTWLSHGMICTRCENCGGYWETPDRPMDI